MKTEQIVRELEGAVQQLGWEIRRERGDFRGGRCLLGDRQIVLLNKRHPPEVHLAVLAEALRDLPVDTIFLRPAVREIMEGLWDQPARDDLAAMPSEQAEGEQD